MKKLVVAIFEDDEINRFIYKNLLKSTSERLDVHLFDTPEAGLEMAKTVQFDIVFIEIHFWGQSFYGSSILHRLKEVSKADFIAIAVTSLLQDGDMERIITAGFTMCMEKPLSFDSIRRIQEFK